MADPPRYPDRGDDADAATDREPTARTSVWTKVLIAVIGLLFLAVIILHLLSGGGPGNH
jgi:hypothetical protein